MGARAYLRGCRLVWERRVDGQGPERPRRARGRAASSSERREPLAPRPSRLPRAAISPPSTRHLRRRGSSPGHPRRATHASTRDCASSILRMRPIVVFAVTAGGVFSMYAPPAMTFRHEPHFQMPVAWRLTLSFPQKTQLYFECWLTSIFLMFFRMDAPYRMPYLPQIPTFFVRLPIFLVDLREGW